ALASILCGTFNVAEWPIPAISLPIASTVALRALEEELKTSNDSKKRQAVSYLTGKGSSDFGFKDCTYRVLGALLTPEVAKGINWRGDFQKLPFRSLVSVLAVVKAAVKRLHPMVVEGDIEAKVISFLKKGNHFGRKKK
ncbi:unnamed protein product, partial [Cyprideis torosa]